MPRLLFAEYRKLTSTRLWLWMLLAAAAITALYVSLQIAFADDPDTWTFPLTTVAGQRTLLASAASAAAPLTAVLGAVGITGEYRHRTATFTFLATPDRSRVIVAKLMTYSLVGIFFAATCTAVAAAIAWPWLGAKGITLHLTASGNLATIAGVVAASAVFALIGLGLGALLKDQVATVVGLLIYLFVVEPVLTGIGALQSWTSYLPGPARGALTGSALTNRVFLDPWQGGLALLTFALLLATLGTIRTAHGDIT